MIVTLWRHGEAGDAVTDRERALIRSGEEDISFGSGVLHQACESRSIGLPDYVCHSPWLRTSQTAKIAASVFTDAILSCEDSLHPDSDTRRVDHLVERIHGSRKVPAHLLLIMHQPLISRQVDFYLADAGAVPPLSPGAFCTLKLDTPAAGCGELLFWSAPPQYALCQ